MRLRNVKNAKSIVENSNYVIKNPEENLGRFKEIFNNDKPINIEIGMGKGDFIIGMAKKYPDINFIGIEKYESVMVRAIEKLDEIDLPNLKLIRMDAINIDKVFNKEIHQKTDNRNLFEFSVISLVNNGYKLEDLSLDLHNSNRENIIMSEYEKKFVSRNNVIYYLVAKK